MSPNIKTRMIYRNYFTTENTKPFFEVFNISFGGEPAHILPRGQIAALPVQSKFRPRHFSMQHHSSDGNLVDGELPLLANI